MSFRHTSTFGLVCFYELQFEARPDHVVIVCKVRRVGREYAGMYAHIFLSGSKV